MPQVIVNTDDLRDGSNSFTSASTSISSLSERLSHIPGTIVETGFEGQFAPKVRALLSASQATASGQQKHLDDLSGELLFRADKMDEVTSSSSQRMSNVGAFFSELWKKSPIMWLFGEISQLPKTAIAGILLLGFISPGLAMGVLALSPIIRSIGEKLIWKGKTYNGNPETKSVSQLNITTKLNFRDTPGMNGAIISVLPIGAIVTVIGTTLQKDGHTWVEVKSENGKTGWIAQDILTSSPGALNPTTSNSNPSPLSTSSNFISQTNPDGDSNILDMKINASGKTVRQDIQKEGCQMTCYTMLLKDKGINVTVTDVYKANWEADPDHRGKTWANDAVKDGIGGENTYIYVDMKNLSGNKYTQTAVSLSGKDEKAELASLSNLLNNGSVILHVKKSGVPSHFIVVDRTRNDLGQGYFDVRDPLSGKSETIQIGTSGKYQIYDTDGHRMLSSL